MNNNDVMINDHCWALLDGQLIVVMKVELGSYVVCGGWECTINYEDLDLLELIKLPLGRERNTLYYGV